LGRSCCCGLRTQADTVPRKVVFGLGKGLLIAGHSCPQTNATVTHASTVSYRSYVLLRRLRHLQGDLHQDYHHHISFMELGHLLTRSGLTYPQVSSKVHHDSFSQLGNSISLPLLIYFEAFYLHVVSGFSCIPVICPKLVLFLTPLQSVHLLCNLSEVYPAVLMSTPRCET